MSGQPLNSDIKVYRTVRAYRNQRRHESIEAITKRLRPLIMSVPADEILTEVKTRDTAKKDFSVYGRDGQPIVIGPKSDISYETAQETLPDVDFAFTIGADKFITNTAAGLTGDLHQDLRDL
jgi:hypothetical protein